MIHSFLLIGQSNMAGRGFMNEAEPISDPRLKVLRNGRWQPLYRPVNNARPFSGVCLAESFALAYAQEHDVEVGLIPCADGGTCLDQWAEGSLLYDHAVYQCRLAQRTSNIAGVLWHQGEGDCAEDRFGLYTEKFTKIMAALRRDLGLEDIPFLLGGLGSYFESGRYEQIRKRYRDVNQQLEQIANTTPMTGFVPAQGLGCNPDELHFSASALREFGLRYYQVFTTLEDKNRVFPEKSNMDGAIRSAMELL